MKLSTRIRKYVPQAAADLPIHLLVDFGKTVDLICLDRESADEAHGKLTAIGYTLLPKECPVYNGKEIVIHYTSTTYKDWCNG